MARKTRDLALVCDTLRRLRSMSRSVCCTASIARDAAVRRQLAQLADRGMATIDVEVFGSILCEQCLNLRLCADIAADPSKLAVESTGTGWMLLFLEDGERQPIGRSTQRAA